ncbi:MAG: PTS sugar transporter subunit IIA [Phycisphaerales bacterium]|nr:MAG: PTS sugar transporter subunit IIA [Phycisphaerales bacterium]
MNLVDILTPARIAVPLKASDKVEVIAELVDLLAADGAISDRDEVLRAVLAREEMRSTGIGSGLAVPHAKPRACSKLTAAVGKAIRPIDFASSDGKPCEFVALLVSPPDETGPHIQALARISRVWLQESFREAVRAANTPEELYEAIRAAS